MVFSGSCFAFSAFLVILDQRHVFSEMVWRVGWSGLDSRF